MFLPGSPTTWHFYHVLSSFLLLLSFSLMCKLPCAVLFPSHSIYSPSLYSDSCPSDSPAAGLLHNSSFPLRLPSSRISFSHLNYKPCLSLQPPNWPFCISVFSTTWFAFKCFHFRGIPLFHLHLVCICGLYTTTVCGRKRGHFFAVIFVIYANLLQ